MVKESERGTENGLTGLGKMDGLVLVGQFATDACIQIGFGRGSNSLASGHFIENVKRSVLNTEDRNST